MAAKKLPPPPKPITKGLHAFAERYGPLICPGFVVDEIAEVMLRALDEWVEGKTQRLIKTTVAFSSPLALRVSSD